MELIVVLIAFIILFLLADQYYKLEKSIEKSEKEYLKDRQRDFLIDTILYYDSSKRSITNGRCTYSPAHENTEGCALGRHLDLATAKKMDEFGLVLSYDEVFYNLPIWMQNLTRDFLQVVQSLHDDGTCWDMEGLSEEGKKQVQKITDQFLLEPIDLNK